MAIAKKILKYLQDKKYHFSIIEHKTTFTAWDTAQTEKINPKMVTKTLVLKTDRYYFLAVLSGNRNLDKQKLLKIINTKRKKDKLKVYKKISFAREAWMKKNIPGKVGATPPFGELLKLDVYFDNLLARNKKIYIGSGEYVSSFLIKVNEYIKKENIKRGSFSQKK